MTLCPVIRFQSCSISKFHCNADRASDNIGACICLHIVKKEKQKQEKKNNKRKTRKRKRKKEEKAKCHWDRGEIAMITRR